MGCPFDILATKLGMKKIYGLYFWFSWLPNTEWGRSMWLFLWIFLATKHKTINNFILRKNLRKSLVWCWWNMKWCGVNVSLACCHCSLPLEIPGSFAPGENAKMALHAVNVWRTKLDILKKFWIFLALSQTSR